MFMTSNYYYYITTYYCVSSLSLPYGIHITTITSLRTTVWAACSCSTAYAFLLLNDYVLLCEQHALALRHTRYYYYMTKYYCMSILPLPYGIRVTTFTWLRMTVWAACPCPTAYALLLLHDYVRLCEQLALAVRHTHYSLRTTVWAACPCPTAYELLLLCEQPALPLRHMRYYYYLNTYYCVSSLLLPYGIRVTTITWLRTTVWAACPCPTAYALLLLNDYVRLCEQLAFALRHTRYYNYMTTYDCVSSLPLPYGIRITTITWLRMTVWAACPCPTSYALLLLHHYVLLCEQLAIALRIRVTTIMYCVSSLLLPYVIRVTTIKWLRTTVWAACPCPTAYVLLLLHDYVLLCEQLALVLLHTRYYYVLLCEQLALHTRYYYITKYSLWAACPCPTAYALLHYYVLLCEQLALALRHTRYYYYMTTYDFVSSLPLPYGIRVTTFTWLHTTEWAACPCPTAYTLLLLHHYVLLCEQPSLALRHTRYYY